MAIGFCKRYLAGAVLVLATTGISEAQERIAKLAHGDPAGSPLDQAMHEFAASVHERLGGELAIEVFPASQLVPPFQAADAVRADMIEMAVIPLSALREALPPLTIFDLVFLFPDLTAVDRFQTGPQGRELLSELDQAGLKGLGYLHRGMLQFAANAPIRQPQDLEGQKIRVTGNPLIAEQLAGLGASPTSMAFAEVYSALQAGLMDAATTTVEGIRQARLHEVRPALTLANYAYVGDVLATSSAFWTSLEPEAQAVIESSAADALQTFNSGVIETEQTTREELAFTALEREDRRAWLETVAPVWQPHIDEIGRDQLFAALETGGLVPSWLRTAALPHDPPSPLEPESLFWNAWFEDGRGVVPQDEIHPWSEYSFVLDLSRFDLDALSGGAASAAPIGQKLADEIARADQLSIDIRVRAVLIGATAPGDSERTQRMSLHLDRLTHPVQVAALGSDPDFYELAQAGRVGVVGGASDNRPYEIRLQTHDPACAAVALSIWDATGRRPLDHLIYRFRIGTIEEAGAECATDAMVQPFESGFATLLQVTALAAPAEQAQPIAAALHVFEVDDLGRRTVGLALFAEAPNSDDVAPSILAWQLADPLSHTLGSENFRLLLERAQTNAVAPTAAGGGETAYAPVAEELQKRLFKAANPADQQAASEAFRALQVLVEQAEEPPLVLARLVGSGGELLYLPLRLLSAGGREAQLKKSFRVVQPLPRERYVSARSCVMPWAFGLPEALVGEVDLASSPVPETGTDWLRPLIRTRAELEAYVAPAGPEPPPAEGLLLVAHQANGLMWFEDETRFISSGELQRRYSGGSVAVLAACAAAGLDDKNRLVLDQLNLQGMDAIIAAPYQVNLDYGVSLAVELATAIESYRLQPRAPSPTIVELFEEAAARAAERTAARLPGPPRPLQPLMDMRYEFQILGDHGVQLCGPDEAGGGE